MTDRRQRATLTLRPQVRWMLVVAAMLFAHQRSPLAQEKPAEKLVPSATESDEAKRSREELQISLEQVAPMQLRHITTEAIIERVEHPVLRYTAPLWGGHHGTLWLWGKSGRPMAVLEMSLVGKEDVWYRSFHSTTNDPIKLDLPNGKSWIPKSSNVQFKPLLNAPRPAETPAGRLRQMKSLLKKMSAHQLWTWPEGDGSRHELRLLTTPVHRYEDRDQHLIDGALLIIAQGTNPEATLFLEAVNPVDASQPFWQFGIGRCSFAEQIVNYEDQEIYHEPPVKYDEIFNSENSYWRTTSKVNETATKTNVQND